MSDRAGLQSKYPAHGITGQPAIHPIQARYPDDCVVAEWERRLRAVRRWKPRPGLTR